MTTLEQAVRRGVGPQDAEYWRILKMTDTEAKALAAQAQHPEPEHTSRDPWPDGVEAPEGFVRMEREAESAGWAHARTYSRGWSVHGTTGAPSKYGERIALRMRHPETGCRAVVIYYRNKRGESEFESAIILGPGLPPYAKCNATEAKDFIILRGLVLPSWLDTVRARVAETERKRKNASKSKSKPREHA